MTVEFAPEKVGRKKKHLQFNIWVKVRLLSVASDIAFLAKGEVKLDIPTLPQLKAEVSKLQLKL